MPLNRPKSFGEIEDARRHLTALLEARGVWFLHESRDGRVVELRRSDWELHASAGALVLTYEGEVGARTWRVSAWHAEGESLFIEAARRMGAERALLRLVPRALVASAREAVASARRAECERIAALVGAFTGAKCERACLSPGARRGEPGRWARIILNQGARGRLAVTAPVVPACAGDAESFLSSALLWLARLEDGARSARFDGLWLVAPHALASAACERVALLREDLRARTSIFKFDEETDDLIQVAVPTLDDLLDAPVSRLTRPAAPSRCELAASVIALAPTEIDCVRARHGETLRFNGLPFARVRRVYGREHLWFGVEGTSRRRTLLDEESAPGFMKLVGELREHRRADAADRKHALYRAAPEAWLEALLRRDVTRLDPGLRLAPLHTQFRIARSGGGARPVDLLALRHDGRLVVIELKVSEDAALALQGADYWHRISTYNRAGHIGRARLFGDAEISDEPPLVYLVAPMLRFHRSFQTLARCISREIEMYRFDLNEDWRAGVRVARRMRVV
ncbi:MAG: hypothetical protein QOE46_785 [Acidobacteriota bacterium]|jgi:hypothetical protein|nr:hypothetical protein [Acidobacteriota bacterium]